MKMSTEGAPKKDMVKKVKKQKKDKIPEMKTENIIKTEKMLVETPDNNDMKKKKKKRKLTTEPDNVTDDAYVVKVSKKKIEHIDSADNLHKELVRDKKKKKKNKSKSVQTEPNIEIVKIEDVEDSNAQQDVKITSKKANKVKNKTEEKPEKKTEKDKKKRTKQLTNKDISDVKTVKAKKPKKDKSKLEENGIKMKSSESGQIEDVKVKKKKLSLSVAKEMEKTDSSQVKKKKHKKAKSENEMDTVVDTRKMTQDFNVTQNHKPKKKKMSEESDKKLLLVECAVNEEAANISKLKKHSTQVESKVDVEAGAGTKKKKKKIKEEKEEQEEYQQVELVFLSEKAGNIDEVNVNKERRKALQMEIDQASQPEKPAKPLGLGQWSTAEFGSSEQQQKFLRLMGGFKKGFQPASVSGGGGNMALGRDAQQQLQQGLLGQFERAHSRHMDSNKGAGLGFAAPSTKKFSIDAKAIHSIRFDD